MTRIDKKVWPEYFQAIMDGRKSYELRLADFECKPADTLVPKEWEPSSKTYTGHKLEKHVTYVGKMKDHSFWPNKDQSLRSLFGNMWCHRTTTKYRQ